MLILFTLTSVAGFAVSYLFGVRFTIGASAAICGFIGAIVFYAWSRGGAYGQNLMRQVSGWLIGLLIIGMMPNINNFAHGGGLVAGFALAWLLGYGDQSREGLVQKAVAGFCVLATVIGLVLAVIGGVYARFVM
jgi:rhomboid protease GluP